MDTTQAPSSRVAALRALRDALTSQAMTDEPVEVGERIEVLRLTEEIGAAVSALQLVETTRFARRFTQLQIDGSRDDDIDPAGIRRSIVDQVALACRTTPWDASRTLNAGRALTQHLTATFAALCHGRISRRVADSVVAATTHLDAAGQQAVDRALDGELDDLGSRRADALARQRAYAYDPAGFVQRGRHARTDRRIGLRPAPDTMSVLTGYLPVEQGVSCLAALRQHTDTVKAAGDGRARDQIMADTLVERLTGQVRAEDVNVELQLVMPVESLTSDPTRAVTLAGFGPVPAGTARDILATGDGRRWWRRLFSGPDEEGHRTVVGGDPRRRFFDPHLRRLINARDQRCRAPFCDAVIRTIDHIQPHAAGGLTVLENGQGLCEHHNLSKELPGWTVIRLSATKIMITTPTRHRYLSRAPAPP